MSETLPTPFEMEIAHQIWDTKYRFKKFDGTPIDIHVEDTWWRIANHLASVEESPDDWAPKFYKVLEDWTFIPAGRIVAGAGTGRNVTLFNCLAAETLVLTAQYGLVPISEIAGEIVSVMDANGEWVEAPINSFGEQPVAAVSLKGGYNGRAKKTIRATSGHRWIMADRTEKTTSQLAPGDSLVSVRRANTPETKAYRDGVVHGIVYGDGSFERADSFGSTFRVRLCGAKADLLRFFDKSGVAITNPPSFDGDPLLRLSNCRDDLKALPTNPSTDYLVGFLRGWFATDGSVCGRDRKAILSCGIKELEWLRQNGAVSGMEVAYATRLPKQTNYGLRNKAIFNVSLRRWTMIPEDFLMQHHKDIFGEIPIYSWVVESVGEYGEPEPVFCPRVGTTDSVQLDLGIHTGQCYVMGTIPDSMPGIFENLKEAALTMQQGGGIGYDFSTLRPMGAEVKGVHAEASGPLSFMDCWDAMCRTVMSAGTRRGAMMATMRCDHPDVVRFIHAKRDPAKLRMFNVSVLCTDDFMEAVENDSPWNLVFKGKTYETVQARELWDAIMENTYNYAEPGVIFIDRINNTNNLKYIETIAATNPCAEQPLPPYGACLLGSINLTRMVLNPFTDKSTIDFDKLKHTVRMAIRMMDNVVDSSLFPLEAQMYEAKAKRRLGLGITGLADLLIMLKIKYGSDKAAALTNQIMAVINVTAYEYSIELAEEKGHFPGWHEDGYLDDTFFSTVQISSRHREMYHKSGIRNSHLTSIAPTGTISLYAGNISSGIEPVFAFTYTRNVTQKDGTRKPNTVFDYAVQKYREIEPDGPLPDYFVSAQTLTPSEHVRMQAAAQQWVDSSISKTVNCPADISFEDFKAVYIEAYKSGCKGCTTYRPNDVTGSILEVTESQNEKSSTPEPQYEETALGELLTQRPEVLDGSVYKIKIGSMDHAVYVTITDMNEFGTRRPYEVFVNTKDPNHMVWMTALTRMISAVFRRPYDSSFVVGELKTIFDPNFHAFWKQRSVPSVVAAIGMVIEEHMHKIGYISTDQVAHASDGLEFQRELVEVNSPGSSVICPKCFSSNIKNESGCYTCLDCGHSKCG